MAAAILGSSLKTFPNDAIPRLVVRAMRPFKYPRLTTWKRPWPPRRAAEGSPLRQSMPMSA